MLLAKIAAPLPARAELQYPLLSQAAKSRLTVFTAPAGYLCTDSLAAILKEHGRPTVWLRFGPEDADPAVCLASLIASAQKLCPTVGLTTLERMRRYPGPATGWPPLFAYLGQEVAKAFPASTTWVMEHIHHVGDAHPTLGLLGAHLLPSLPTSATCILISHVQVPSTIWPPYAIPRGINDLRLDAYSASALFQRADAGLPTHCIERAVALTAGRADVLAGLRATAVGLDPAPVQKAIEGAADLNDLVSRVTCACLAAADTDTLQALALAVKLGYSHPALVQATLGNVTLSANLWLQALADDWTRIRCVCKTPLRTALGTVATPSRAILHRMADYLASHDAIEQAVPMYYELGDTASAARAIGQVADTMLNLGQWQTLSNWLGQLTRQAQADMEKPSPLKRTRLWNRLLSALGVRRHSYQPTTAPEWYTPTPQGILPNITETVMEAPPETISTPILPKVQVPGRLPPAIEPFARLTLESRQSKAKDEKQLKPLFAIYCLGSFRVYYNNELITGWKSLKGYSILKYLAAHRDKPVAKDILMDVFWPDADHVAARRNLHQAIYALRQILKRAQPNLQLIQFENDCYLLNTELDVWLDFEEFEQHVQTGRRLAAVGQVADAVAEYAVAESLYQGDFLEEDLYEDWPRSQREHLRTIYLDSAERLSAYYVQLGQHNAAVTLCQKVLDRDHCHEESHRRLMQCYLAQGQRHLAIRQYQMCLQALKEELDLTPSEETSMLYRHILSTL